MANAETDFGRVADDLRRAATSFALLTSSASAFGAALNDFREFERQLTLTNAIAGGTVAQFNQMKDAAREFSLVTTVSAQEAGIALQQLAQAGFTAQESLGAMNGVLLLAQATLSDVATTADVISSNIRAFGLSVTDTTRIANVFSATITGSLATIDKLAFAMRQVAPVAELAGLSIEETSAALGTLFNIGLRGEQAGTALRNIIIRLVRPLGDAGDKLIEAGIATKTATGEFRNLNEILTEIGKSSLTDSDLAIIFETEALAGVKAYIKALEGVGDSGSEYYRLLDAITDTDRAVQLAAANLNTLDGSLGLLTNTMSDIRKEIGEELAPVVVEMADYVRELYGAFQDLDPATQATIVKMAALGTTAVGLLAGMNALFLLIKGPLVGSIGIAYSALTIFGGAMLGTATPTTSLISKLGQMAGFLAGTFLRSVGFATLSMFGFSTALALPLTGVVAGIAVVGAAIYGLSRLMDEARITTEEYYAQFAGSGDKFNAMKISTREAADLIMGENTPTEIKARVEAINNQLKIIRTATPLDQLGYAGRNQALAQQNATDADDIIKKLEAEYDVALDAIDLKERTEAAIAAALANDENKKGLFGLNALVANLYGYDEEVGDAVRNKVGLTEILDNLTAEQRAAFEELGPDVAELLKQRDDALQQVVTLTEVELENTVALLQSIAEGTASLGPEFDQALSLIEQNGLLKDKETVQRLAEAIAGDAGAPSIADILRPLLEESNLGISAEEIEDLLTIKEQQATQEVFDGIKAIQSGLEDDYAKIKLAAIENSLEASTNMAEALGLATELGYGEMQADIKKLQSDQLDDFRSFLTQFGIDFRIGVGDSLETALDASGFGAEFDIPPQFRDVLSGASFIDGVNGAIDESTTPEEAEAIIAQQSAMFTAIIDSYVDALVAAGTITSEQAEKLRAAGKTANDVAAAAFVEGFGNTAETIKKAQERIQREADKATRERAKAARDLETAVKKALKDAEDQVKEYRKLEDAFRDIADTNYDIAETIFEASRGFGLATREAFIEDLELTEIGRRYDDQILELQRTIEDVEFNFTGSNEQLALLKKQYGDLIERIQLAKDAEIDAAQSYTAQMERRSKALDLFIRDIDDAAFASQNVYTQIGAGITKAFAEYNKDVVTLVDIAANATTTFIDGVTSSLSDAIYEAESFGDAMKAVFRDISKQSFAAFTKGFLQQGISSLTGGGGSILGNGVMGSPNGNTDIPGVGTGGVLGMLFPGLKAATGQDPLSDALQSIAADAKQAGLEPVDAFNSVAQQIRAAGQATAQALRDTATAISGGVGTGSLTGAGGTGSLPLGMGNSGTGGFPVAGGLGYAGLGAASTGALGGGAQLGYSTASLASGIATSLGQGIAGEEDLIVGLIERGFSTPQAQGIVANFIAESGLNPGINEAEPVVPGSRGGYGLYQLTGSRRTDFEAFAQASGQAFDSTDAQLDFMVQELKTTEKKAYALLQQATTAEDAAATFSKDFLRPGTPHLDNRLANARRLEEQYSGVEDQFSGVNEQFAGVEYSMGEAATSLQDYAQNDFPTALQAALPGVAAPGQAGYAGTPPFLPQTTTPAISGGAGVGSVTGGAGSDLLGGLGIPGVAGAAGGTGNPQLDAAYQQFQVAFQTFTTQITQTLTDFGTQFAQALNNAIQAVNNAAGASGAGTVGFNGGAGGSLGQLAQLASFIPGFDTGGKIAGEGTGTSDSILARVSNGEFIVKARQTSKYGELLEAINNDTLNGYAIGGIIGNGGFDYLRKDGGSKGNSVDNSSVGDTIALTVNYMMNGGNSGGDSSFRRSASQNAKQIGRQLSRAKRNN